MRVKMTAPVSTIENEAEPTPGVYDQPTWLDLDRAVLADPDDNGPRRAAAKWLDERDPPRGVFVRLQLQTVSGDRLTHEDMERDLELRRAGGRSPLAERARADRRMDQYLRRCEREVELIRDHGRRWYPDLPVGLIHHPPRERAKVYGVLHRGFVGEIGAETMDDWIGVGPELVRRHPITTVTIRLGDDGNPLGHRLREQEREKLRRATSERALLIAKKLAAARK